MKFNRCAFFVLCVPFLLGGLVGCASKSNTYQIGVGNSHTIDPITNAQIIADGKVRREFDRIGPHKMAGTPPKKGRLPESIEVIWVDAKGVQHRAAVPGDTFAAGQRFVGQLVLEVDENQKIQVYSVEGPREELSPIPWNAPEEWEGTIGIPGMETN